MTMMLTQALTHALQTHPNRQATQYADRVRSWGEVGERVSRFAAALRSAGLRRGDRVAVLAYNSDNYIELFFSIAWAGLVMVPLNTRWAVRENVYSLQDADCSALMVDDRFAGQVAEVLRNHPLKCVIHVGETSAPGFFSYEKMIVDNPPMANACGRDNDLCGIYYTGGTTGEPKGVMLTHTNFVSVALNWIATMHLTHETVYMHSAGLFHLGGASPAIAITMAAGCHVCLPKFDALQAFQTIQRHRVNSCLLVPVMINVMIHHPAFSDYDLTGVMQCFYGASPMPDAVLSVAMSKLPSWQFIQVYGMTESTALSVILPWANHFETNGMLDKRKATGRATFGNELMIVDADGKEVPRGELGELVLRGAQVMLGYWHKPNETDEALRDGWLHTGDAGRMDTDGFVYIVDRVKDMIISGGENIYSREVENAVYLHASVRDCAVIGVPSQQWGEAVLAVVTLKDGYTCTERELIDHCRSLIAAYKCPQRVVFCEALPVSGAGKIMKALLREPYWKEQTKSVN